jgi:lysophospholipase L1-like esterase
MSERRATALFGAVAAALVTVVSLGMAEVALRLADYPPAAFSPWIRDDELGFRLAPGSSTRMRGPEYDVEIATNSAGYRDDEPGDASGGILLLGDSFAMGYGVERGKLFADLLEKDVPARVFNAGTGGYEIVQQPRVLERLAPKLEPDLVLFALYLGNDLAQNDEWEVRADGSLHNRKRVYPVRQQDEGKLVRLLRDFVYGVRQGRSEKEGEWLPFEGYLGLCERNLGEEARKDYDEAGTLVGELAARARELRVPLFVVLLPYRPMVEAEALASLEKKVPDLRERYDLGRPAREIGARLAASGIDFVDATPWLVEEHSRSGRPLFFPIDGHLTEAGHAVLAARLAPLVRERLEAGDR